MQDAIRLFLEAGVFLVTPTVWCVKHPNSSPPQSLGIHKRLRRHRDISTQLKPKASLLCYYFLNHLVHKAMETQGHLHAVEAQSLSSMLLVSKPWSRAILYSSCPSPKTFFLRKNLAQK